MAERKLDPVEVLGADRDAYLRRVRTRKAVPSNVVRIEGWCTRPGIRSRYQAPETATGTMLSGRVYGHPGFSDGETVFTSDIVKVEGRLITTGSGRVYRLGRPDGKWLAWLRREGRRYDRREPIKDLRQKEEVADAG